MISSKYNTKQKQFHFKAYQELSKLENALNSLKEENATIFQVSILGKLTQFCSEKDIESFKDTITVKSYWQDRLGKTINFGTYYNIESGSVFIVGSLATTFLRQINGKSLATLSSGPYGIFRGLGVGETDASRYLKMLYNDSYLLIIRCSEKEIERIA